MEFILKDDDARTTELDGIAANRMGGSVERKLAGETVDISVVSLVDKHPSDSGHFIGEATRHGACAVHITVRLEGGAAA